MQKKLYLIPGTMCNEKLWAHMLPHLDASLELVYLTIPLNKNFDELALHYKNIIGEEPVYLVGFSLGGYIATYFAMLYPERVAKLFVISNSPTSLPAKELHQRSNILKYAQTYGYHGMSRKKIADLLDDANQTQAYIDYILNMDSDLGEATFVSQYQYTSERADLFLAITQFSFDIHLYFSEGDKMIDAQWIHRLNNSNPKIKLIETTGKGHMLPLEKPKALANYINDWLAQ